MCVYVYVCIYIYTYTYICICMCLCICMCVCTVPIRILCISVASIAGYSFWGISLPLLCVIIAIVSDHIALQCSVHISDWQW